MNRPTLAEISKNESAYPASAVRVLKNAPIIESIWIGPKDVKPLSKELKEAYKLAHNIMIHLAVMAPLVHKSGHPGGALSAFTFCYGLLKRRQPGLDAPLRMSAGHLSVLGFGLQYLGGREGHDERLQSPESIINTFRTPGGLPGHCEAGIGDIPFGFGPLGKGLSSGLGHALGKKLKNEPGITDVMMGDGDCQEGQVMEAARLAAAHKLDNLVAHIDMNDIQLSTTPTQVVSADLANQFAAMGWYIIEVQNGNDPEQVEAALDEAEKQQGKERPVCVIYYTTMGHGVKVMEEASNNGSAKFHGSPLTKEAADEALKDLPALNELVASYQVYHDALQKAYINSSKPNHVLEPPTANLNITDKPGAARKDFGAKHVAAFMAEDERIVVLHADVAGSGGYTSVAEQFPNRVINVGAAEANMYMMAAGLRQAGILPITYTFGAFGTNEARANARLIDINNSHTPCGVFHDCTHVGLSVGEDGETHQERHYLDIPFDNTQVWNTADSNQAAAMAKRGLEIIAEGNNSIFAFFPRSGHNQITNPDGEVMYGASYQFDGKVDIVRGTNTVDDQITIISTGMTIHNAIEAADELMQGQENIVVRVLNVSCVRPLDATPIIAAALDTSHIIVVEDHSSETGLAHQVADIIADFQLPCSFRRMGVDNYFPSGKAEDLFLLAGLDTENIVDTVLDEVRKEVGGGEDALLTCLHEMSANAHRSRFRTSVLPYMTRIASEKDYLEALRQVWINRTCSNDNLPTTSELKDRIAAQLISHDYE